jgi:hypothetical protein
VKVTTEPAYRSWVIGVYRMNSPYIMLLLNIIGELNWSPHRVNLKSNIKSTAHESIDPEHNVKPPISFYQDSIQAANSGQIPSNFSSATSASTSTINTARNSIWKLAKFTTRATRFHSRCKDSSRNPSSEYFSPS